MAAETEFDAWSAGAQYEQYMGRWSRQIAGDFVAWLALPPGLDWVELGCGTGALTQAILGGATPGSVLATDPSAAFVAHARGQIEDGCVRFEVADARQIPCADGTADVVTSALVLNFIPDREAALGEMRRILRPVGTLAFYVWDYPGDGMGFISAFWTVAAEIDPEAAARLNERARFPFCTEAGLRGLCTAAGFGRIAVTPLERETHFPDFEAFWLPFTLGAGPAPGYCQSLPETARQELKARLAAKLGTEGPVVLPARAWAVRAQVS